MIYIVAGNFEEARRYADNNKISACFFRYICQPDTIRGLKHQSVVCIGTYAQRADIKEMMAMIHDREFVILKRDYFRGKQA